MNTVRSMAAISTRRDNPRPVWSEEEQATWAAGAAVGAASGAIFGLITAFVRLTGVPPAVAAPSDGAFRMIATILAEAAAGAVLGAVAGALIVVLIGTDFGSARTFEDLRAGARSGGADSGAWLARRGMNRRAGRFAGESDSDATDRSPYHGHYARTYAPVGTRYEEVAAAYEYGAQAADEFAGRRWDEMMPELRALWERENPASWDRYRDAVRHGWESRAGAGGQP